MSAAFTDIHGLARLARAEVDDGADCLQHWYEDRFRRSADAGAYEDRSAAHWTLCMFRDLWRRRTAMMEEMNQMAGAASRSKQAARDRDHLISRINEIQRAFNLPLVYFDAVAARWDAELAKGKTPDLNRH